MSLPRFVRFRPRDLTGALLIALVTAAGSLPAASAAMPASQRPMAAQSPMAPAPERLSGTDHDPSPQTPVADTGVLPTIHYEEAMAHAADRIAFKPGGRVDVGYTPRVLDTWQIDGRPPRALPAGHASGTRMSLADQGSEWAGKPAPVATAPAAPSADAITPAAPITPAGAGLLRQVFGFLPYWELSDSSTTLNYDVLSTIAYFSVGADTRGNLLKRNPDGSTTTGWSGWTSQRLTDVIAAAHRKRTRVVLTITMFAWTTGQRARQAALLGSPAARLNLARQTAAAVRDRGADGVNLDFEPIASGYAEEFTALVRTMRTELNRIAPGYQLTFDTTGYIGNYPIEAATAPGGADAIFIMGYDYRTAGTSPVGSIAPLGGSRYDVVDTIREYAARVPASKLILGVPYYGRAWSTSTSRLNARNISGTKYGASAAVIYSRAMPLLAQHGRRWDSREKVAWTAYRRQTCTPAHGCVTAWRELYIDDAAALRVKYDTIIRYRLRGAGIWALGYDDGRPELDQALAQKFLHDTSGPVAGVRLLAIEQPEEAFRVRWTGYDISGIRSYDVQVWRAGGPWRNWLTRTTKTSELYPGVQGQGYAFRVRATDKKGNVGPWNVASVWGGSTSLAPGRFGMVRVDGLARRTGPTLAATKVGELFSGEMVSVVAGPVSADGHTWWQVVGPIVEWRPVVPLAEPTWVAEGPSSGRYLTGSRAPNATLVDAFMRGLSFGDAGRASIGPAGVAHRAFSPDADGARDKLRLRWTTTTVLDTLQLRVHRTDGTLVGAIPLTDRAAGAHAYDFDGRLSGSVLADGAYVLALVGTVGTRTLGAPTSEAITPTVVAAYGIRVDTVPPRLTGSSASGALLSPNRDGRFDSLTFKLITTGATGWRFTVQPLVGGAAGAPVRAATGSGPATVAWFGGIDGGGVAQDGRYRITLRATDPAGNSVGRGWDVIVDSTPATLGLTAAPVTFSPDGDGVGDTSRLSWTSDEAVSGRVRLLRGTATVRTWTFTARTAWAVTWDGKDGGGAPLPDGSYTLRVDGLDRAGTATVIRTPVRLDRTAGALSATPPLFYPQDGDAYTSTSRIAFQLRRAATTTLEIQDRNGTLVRRLWTDRRLTAGRWTATWNGRDAAGASSRRPLTASS